MKGLFYSLLGYFLTPAGVVVMGALDSSMVFFLPLGIDFVVIRMSAGLRENAARSAAGVSPVRMAIDGS